MNNTKSINLLAIVVFGCIQIHAMDNKPKPPSTFSGNRFAATNVFKNQPSIFKSRPSAFEKKAAPGPAKPTEIVAPAPHNNKNAQQEIEQFRTTTSINNAQAMDLVRATFYKLSQTKELTVEEIKLIEAQMQAIALSNQQAFEQAQASIRKSSN